MAEVRFDAQCHRTPTVGSSGLERPLVRLAVVTKRGSELRKDRLAL